LLQNDLKKILPKALFIPVDVSCCVSISLWPLFGLTLHGAVFSVTACSRF